MSLQPITIQEFAAKHPELVREANYHMAADDEPAAPGTGWSEPEPLASKLPPVEAMTPDLLPPVLKPWIEDICERTQIPLEFVAVPAIVAAGSIIGRRVAMFPKRQDSWHEFPNLWGCIVGRPGLLKSPALEAALKPLRKLEAAAMQGSDELAKRRKAVKELADIKADIARKRIKANVAKGVTVDPSELLEWDEEEESERPPVKRYVVNNFSLEALGEVLQNNPSLLIFQDELSGLLASLDRPGNEELRPFLLQGWSGKESFTFDRIKRGLNRYISPFGLSVLGGIQPGKLAKHLKAAAAGGAGDDGFVQRLNLMVWPDVGRQWVNIDRLPDLEAEVRAFDAVKALDDLEAGDEPRGVRFSPEAAEMFLKWRTELERRLRAAEESPAFESHLSKFRKLVPALALIFALLKDADAQMVGAEELALALRWASLLESHARRAYGSAERPDTEAATRLLAKLIAGDLGTINARSIYRKCWSGLATPAEADAALQLLEGHGWIRPIMASKSPDGGRPSIEYALHPDAAKFHRRH